MMINRRRACGGKSLPYDAEIEYLETSDNYCFINTGIKTTSSTKFDFDFYVPDMMSAFWLFGGRVANGGDQNAVFANTTKYFVWRYGNQNLSCATYKAGRYSFSNTGNACVLKINSKSYTSNSSTFTTDIDYYIFTIGELNDAGHNLSYIGVRFYKGKMYSSEILVRDYIPVRKGTTGYLYDKVSGQLFGNSGTGSFILGPDV